ncbi:uncharacterized protein CC84DRAFT_1206921, partial [Paraphaeosphaeria sporulosa]
MTWDWDGKRVGEEWDGEAVYIWVWTRQGQDAASESHRRVSRKSVHLALGGAETAASKIVSSAHVHRPSHRPVPRALPHHGEPVPRPSESRIRNCIATPRDGLRRVKVPRVSRAETIPPRAPSTPSAILHPSRHPANDPAPTHRSASPATVQRFVPGLCHLPRARPAQPAPDLCGVQWAPVYYCESEEGQEEGEEGKAVWQDRRGDGGTAQFRGRCWGRWWRWRRRGRRWRGSGML